MTGPIIRHGPHHAAQKSTMKSPLAIADLKLESLSSTGCPFNDPLHFPHTAFLPAASAGTRFNCPQDGQRTSIPDSFCETRAMIRTATRADLSSLRALFARANDAPHEIGRAHA